MMFLKKQQLCGGGEGSDSNEENDREILNKLILIGVNRIDQRSLHG